MDKTKLFISTIAADAHAAAVKYGVNLEIAEYCTAWNMDEEFSAADPLVRQKLEGVERVILHAPFNELFPCAILNDMATFDQAGIDDSYLDEIRQGDKFTVEGSR